MTNKREEKATSYLTENEDGVRFTVIEWVTVITSRPLSGPVSISKGARRWTLVDGSDVNYVDDNTFQVLKTDEILRKVR
jgi:hypothetical protein